MSDNHGIYFNGKRCSDFDSENPANVKLNWMCGGIFWKSAAEFMKPGSTFSEQDVLEISDSVLEVSPAALAFWIECSDALSVEEQLDPGLPERFHAAASQVDVDRKREQIFKGLDFLESFRIEVDSSTDSRKRLGKNIREAIRRRESDYYATAELFPKELKEYSRADLLHPQTGELIKLEKALRTIAGNPILTKLFSSNFQANFDQPYHFLVAEMCELDGAPRKQRDVQGKNGAELIETPDPFTANKYSRAKLLEQMFNGRENPAQFMHEHILHLIRIAKMHFDEKGAVRSTETYSIRRLYRFLLEACFAFATESGRAGEEAALELVDLTNCQKGCACIAAGLDDAPYDSIRQIPWMQGLEKPSTFQR